MSSQQAQHMSQRRTLSAQVMQGRAPGPVKEMPSSVRNCCSCPLRPTWPPTDKKITALRALANSASSSRDSALHAHASDGHVV